MQDNVCYGMIFRHLYGKGTIIEKVPLLNKWKSSLGILLEKKQMI